jgi:signal transduction histidine kinase
MAEVRGPDDQLIGTVEIVRDTTLEKALHRQRDTFITNAAHELRGPLTNLKARLYLLRRQPEKLHEHVEMVERATDHMAEMVQDLVDLAQFTKGNLKLNRRTIDLHHVIQSTLSIQQPHAFRVRVDLRQNFPDTPIYINADHQRLMQTFNNLIANAIQATTPDGRVEITVSVPNNGHSQWVTIQVHNNGPALDQKQMALIFEPFFRPSEGDVKRTGMDLALSKQIIEEHGGSITVSSNPKTGTTFTIQLPLQLPEPNGSK